MLGFSVFSISQLDLFGDLITMVVGKYNEHTAGRDDEQLGSHGGGEDWDGHETTRPRWKRE